MITNSMMRFPPPPSSDPKPRMWKSLGIIAQDMRGFVEAHYELKTFRGDLDPDSEDAIRAATHGLLSAVTQTGRALDPDAVYALQRPRGGLLLVKLAGGYWGQPNVTEGIM
jgi:hypothetical protein